MAIPAYIHRHPDGVALAVKLQPRAKRTGMVGELGERLKIAVSAAPVDGKANEELRRFLARKIGVSKSVVEILRGETAREKSVLIAGVSPQAVLAALSCRP